MNMNLGRLREMVRAREDWRAAAYEAAKSHDWATKQQHVYAMHWV